MKPMLQDSSYDHLKKAIGMIWREFTHLPHKHVIALRRLRSIAPWPA